MRIRHWSSWPAAAVISFTCSTVVVGAASPAAAARSCHGHAATIVGTDRDDTLDGTSGRDVIVGGRGADTIDGRGGDDIICGGVGSDLIEAGDGDDQVWGEWGYDRIKGGSGDDMLDGGPRSDELTGGPGDDRVYGKDGQDDFFSGPGNDLYDGGRTVTSEDLPRHKLDTYDVLDLRDAPAGAVVTINGPAGSDGYGDDDMVRDIEVIDGSAHDDVITGTDAADQLYGEAGNDVLDGRGGDDGLFDGPGNDTVSGGDGNDTLSDDRDDATVERGDDTLNGGTGDDRIEIDRGTQHLDGGPGTDLLTTKVSTDTAVTVDLAAGTASIDGKDSAVAGFENVNMENWGDGSAEAYGRGGDDRIFANGSIYADNVTADGGDGEDKCHARTTVNCEGSWGS
jgi:Ca2+-binding RTX toxin-like protein